MNIRFFVVTDHIGKGYSKVGHCLTDGILELFYKALARKEVKRIWKERIGFL